MTLQVRYSIIRHVNAMKDRSRASSACAESPLAGEKGERQMLEYSPERHTESLLSRL